MTRRDDNGGSNGTATENSGTASRGALSAVGVGITKRIAPLFSLLCVIPCETRDEGNPRACV